MTKSTQSANFERWGIALVLLLLLPLPFGAWAFGDLVWRWTRGPVAQVAAPPEVVEPLPVKLSRGMVWIPRGEFVMGDRHLPAADCRPPRTIELDGFWIDQQPVTNAQFRQFVEATGHVTTAEEAGWSLVFDTNARRWQQLAGTTWQHPLGPRSTLVAADDHPVVHVSWHDAARYAQWAGKRLLTEAEYERAARGGLLEACYAWGDEHPTRDRPLANFWQGKFPESDRVLDGFANLAPVAQFPPNRFGLFDMAGNAWCWCGDWYDPQHYLASPSQNPTGPESGTDRVLRGGSWLSTLDHSNELAAAARHHAPPETTACHIGFRCASTAHPRSRLLEATPQQTTP